MISPSQARARIDRCVSPTTVRRVRLRDSFGSVLATNIKAPFPMPIADNSAMDGYVVWARDTASATSKRPVFLKIAGTLKAGDARSVRLSARTACRIMTGAFIPRSGDAVIPKEDTVMKGKYISVSHPVRVGSHIRKRGEEVRRGRLLLKKGTVLNPAATGVLATFGFANISVYSKPKVTVLATGSELVAPGKKLSRGKIYDSNSWMIRAALSQMGLAPLRVLTLPDRLERVQGGIRSALLRSDCLMLLGGVSVGDYDVVREALRREGVKTIFWKVSQKPGKPLYFGRKGKKIVFGLPGNPAAVFTCFYEYVYPALLKRSGHDRPSLARQAVRVESGIRADSTKHLFLKSKLIPSKVGSMSVARVLGHQGSHMITALVDADGFLRVSPRRSRKTPSVSDTYDMDLLPYKTGGESS